MKIAISTSGSNLSSPVDARFGRCPSFIVLDTNTMEFEVVPNRSVGSAHGAGIQTAQLIASRGVEVVLTGNIGPNAFAALSTSSIKVVSGVSGTVEEVVERFKRGELEPIKGPTVGGHFGTGGRAGGMRRGRGPRA
ncbi:MAG: NifB/NifX family molybdenum-iron cluster-binding protein [Candidatus Bathyarchaeota archaeon]|jgi:predicted Fe-Mo cluster-binding NifX family protein